MKDIDIQLIEDFMRITNTSNASTLEIGTVHWDGPNKPFIQWTAFHTWPHPPDPEQLKSAHQKALHTRKFFRICQKCKERTNIGHMHDSKICQSCAEHYLNVVY